MFLGIGQLPLQLRHLLGIAVFIQPFLRRIALLFRSRKHLLHLLIIPPQGLLALADIAITRRPPVDQERAVQEHPLLAALEIGDVEPQAGTVGDRAEAGAPS